MNYKRFVMYTGFIILAITSNKMLYLVLTAFLIFLNELFLYSDRKKRNKRIKRVIEESDRGNIDIFEDKIIDDFENKVLAREIVKLIKKLKIREQKLKYDNEYMKNVTKVFDGALIKISENGDFVYANDNFYKMFELEKEKTIGEEEKNIDILNRIDQQIKDLGRNNGEIFLESKIYRYDSKILTGDSKDKIIYIRDITAEFKMKSIIGETQKIATIKDFASGVAHEIRNPLTPIKGFLQIMKDNLTSEDEKTKKYLNVIFSEIERIDSKIGNLHRFSDGKKLQKKYENLEELIEDVVDKAKNMINNTGKNIIIDRNYTHQEKKINISSKLIREAIQNILNNSIKAIHKSGEIVIKTRNNTKNLIISIQDNGPGISKENLEKIKNEEIKIDEKAIKLGLIIAKQNIKAHGGKLKIESIEGEGVTVEIKIPIEKEREMK